ncbi:transcriptional regulator ChbR [Thorsellia anophelis]|uniref:AraC family transcriptional regulator, cel operon repressor n=1 Tax=Thorsellia anophelis DSM 18579 TaxID=1123402 RepID=A0A1I0E100_9GAMM|nr:transcriptional regulator ChbR [Thorsellia anophelis]SET37989.1 AraC family transcriptional regulator, cel operon repressor [Thorsellia anophelis DSM 18579]
MDKFDLDIAAPEKILTEKGLFNGKHYYWFLLTKEKSVSGRHKHDFYEFTITIAGRYHQIVDGKKILLNESEFTFIPLGSVHENIYDLGVTTVLNIGMSKIAFESLFPNFLSINAYAGYVATVESHFFSYIQSALNHSIPAAQENTVIEFIENIIFYLANRLKRSSEVPNETMPTWLVETVNKLHDKRYFRENALNYMIEFSNKSQEYLTRSMKRYYDKTPMQLINEIRINYAKTLLSATNQSVADIANECGYSDSSAFIKHFKLLVNDTPNHYRKINKIYQKDEH